jgi:hypothetical protein
MSKASTKQGVRMALSRAVAKFERRTMVGIGALALVVGLASGRLPDGMPDELTLTAVGAPVPADHSAGDPRPCPAVTQPGRATPGSRVGAVDLRPLLLWITVLPTAAAGALWLFLAARPGTPALPQALDDV